MTENDTLIKVGHDAMLAQAGAELELTEGGGGIKELVLEAGRVLSVFRPDGQERTIKNHGVTAGVRAPLFIRIRCMARRIFAFVTVLWTINTKA